MQRFAWIFALVVVIALVGVSDLAGYRNLKAMRAEIKALRKDVTDATRTAQEESAAVAAASQSAEQAAARAAVAAEGRQQAESGRQQAEVVAQKASQQTEAAEAKMRQMQQEREEELNRMQQALNRVAETRRTTNGMVITLPDSMFRFEFDKTDLNQHNRELLSRIAGILLISKGYGLSVFGYTDDIGSTEYNQQLSLRRANAVKDYLIQAGLDAAIVNVKGYGKSSPLIESESANARATNRRVEIALTDSSIHF